MRLLKPILIATCLVIISYLSLLAQSIFDVLENKLDYGAYLFMTPRSLDTCLVTDLSGNTIYQYPLAGRCYDFKILDNGDWIYFDDANKTWIQRLAFSDIITKMYAIKGNHDVTDPHDIIVGDDYIWLMGRKKYAVMTGTAVLTTVLNGSTLQKQDLAGNVLFDWYSQDHIGVDEAKAPLNLNTSYPHSNSFFEDEDGNLIVSFRHTNSVMKICTSGKGCVPGEIIWRLGGVKSDFTFVNDRGIAKQHSAMMTDNCHDNVTRCLLLFDNGNDFEPQYSRAVEYVLDARHGVVTKTWEYTAGGQIFAFATGNVKRLENGDTVIGWGHAHFEHPDAPLVSVVDWDGNLKYEARFTAEGEASYRTHLYPYPLWRQYLPIVRNHE